MSKGKTIRLDLFVRLLFLVVLAFLMLINGINTLVLVFYVPIIAWILWRDGDRIAELEKRLAAYEKLYGKPGSS